MRPHYRWQLRSRTLELGQRTLIMGVVNVTPDSFSDGGKFLTAENAVEHGLELLEEGADIVDVGGESTRPGARLASDSMGPSENAPAGLSEEEELWRAMPVIEGVLRARPQALISVDTYKSRVARAAVEAGAEIVNDVSGFQWDTRMAQTCAELKCGVVLMHTRGRPREWRELPAEADVTATVMEDLGERVQAAMAADVGREHVVIDPGLGFGKNFEQNYPLLARFAELQKLGFPLLAGASRKSFIGRTVENRTGKKAPAENRLYGSLAAMVAAILGGAHIVRVHEVRPAVEAAAIADEILAGA